MKFCALAVLLFASPSFANGLDDLKAALTPLQGLGTLRGAYEVRETRTNLAKPGKGPESLLAAAQVNEDPNSLDISWDRTLLKRAADESSPARGANKKDGLTQLIASTSAGRVGMAVNYAPRLLQLLSVARLKSERADTCQGKPCRLIELAIQPEEAPNDNISIKDNSIAAQFWINADGVPLAAVSNHVVSAKVMVFMSYDRSTREEMAFAVAANRLVVLKREVRGKEKGPGTDNEFQNLYTFTPKL